MYGSSPKNVPHHHKIAIKHAKGFCHPYYDIVYSVDVTKIALSFSFRHNQMTFN